MLDTEITTFVCLNNEYGKNALFPDYANNEIFKEINFIHVPIILL